MFKKKNVKGFILVETMVVIAFLATTLLTVYSSFTTVLDNAKTRIFYDDPVYLYRTYYFLSYLEKNNITSFIDTKFANTSGTDNRALAVVEFGCSALSVTEASGGASDAGFCESLKSSMEISHVFIMNYDVNEVIKCDEQSGNLDDRTLYCQRNKALQNLSISAVNYLYTLDGYTGSSTPDAVRSSGYRIVVEFKKPKTATYEYFDYNKSTTKKETMQETTYNYYYTTLKVPYGYDNRSKDSGIFRRTYIGDTFAYKDPSYAKKIKTITFNDSWSDTTDAVKVWDIGVEPGTVQAFIKDSTKYSGYYDLYIEGKYNLYANSDSSYLIYSLTELEEINNLEAFDTSYTTDMSSMFAVGGWSSKIKSLDVSGLDTSNVTNMYRMFYGNSSLTSLDVSSLDTRNVTNMGSMFAECSKLVDLDLTNLNTSKVTDMSWMFEYDASLESLDLSKFDTSNVTNMSHMFDGGYKLKHLNVSSFNTSKIADMSYTFASLQSLTSLDLSNFDTSNVTNMSDMFSNSFHLTDLNISSFNTSKVTNMKQMLANIAVTSLDLRHFDTRNVINMSGMFMWDSYLTSLDLSSFDTSNVTIMGATRRNLIYKNGVIYSWSLFGEGAGMFEGCSSLTNLDLSNFRTDKVTNMNGMFAKTDKLVSLNISNFNTQNVTDMDVMFHDAKSLTNYNFPVFDIRNVTTMEGIFAGSKISGVSMNRANFKSNINLKQFVDKYQTMSVTVRSSQDKALFDKMGFSRLTVTVMS